MQIILPITTVELEYTLNNKDCFVISEDRVANGWSGFNMFWDSVLRQTSMQSRGSSLAYVVQVGNNITHKALKPSDHHDSLATSVPKRRSLSIYWLSVHPFINLCNHSFICRSCSSPEFHRSQASTQTLSHSPPAAAVILSWSAPPCERLSKPLWGKRTALLSAITLYGVHCFCSFPLVALTGIQTRKD